MPAYDLASLHTFRADLYGCFSRRADALFGEPVDVWQPSRYPHWPISAFRHRIDVAGAASTRALAEGRLDVDVLRTTLARLTPTSSEPVFAVDLSVWPRCDAEASPERGFSDHPSRHSAGQPIVAGWSYQWLTQLS